MKKTYVRCFSLTITYGKIVQRTFKYKRQKKKKEKKQNIEQKTREYRMYNAYAREKKDI